MPIKVITTEDGSHSLFDEELNETYHSTRGALGESQHVFVKEGLAYFVDQHAQGEIGVLEVGFGTGLNAFLIAQFARREGRIVNFTSLEPHPISRKIYSELNYHRSPQEQDLFMAIHEADWEREVAIGTSFRLEKIEKKLEDFGSKKKFNLIFFDAFAPSKQAEVWALDNLRKCFDVLEPGGVLTTYCAQGQFKRNLLEAGFRVETLQGAMGKKEMVRAHKPT